MSHKVMYLFKFAWNRVFLKHFSYYKKKCAECVTFAYGHVVKHNILATFWK